MIGASVNHKVISVLPTTQNLSIPSAVRRTTIVIFERVTAVRAKRRLFVIWVVAVGIGLVLADRFYAAGKAADCRPQQIDGHWGLSTSLGLLYGFVVGVAVVVAATIYVAVAAYRGRAKPAH